MKAHNATNRKGIVHRAPGEQVNGFPGMCNQKQHIILNLKKRKIPNKPDSTLN